ncbi:unnamed protein product [Ceratitis capitata]|uniref:(Mediterranean fruit fly) hypothetical protein n=1 Tax=Ceratitis capitata TaxID=7213 RepID=W8ART1_CERCA|nr:unnamed protein product [Ceratitis capitata]
MWKRTLLLVCLSGCCWAGPLHGVKRNAPIVLREDDAELERPAPEPLAPEYPEMPSTLTLPSNATSIRADITDSFSCDDKVYGYYADVENDCQIFHICLPVTYADGKENTFRWSFICPEETVFSQESFTCMRREDIAFSCEDSVNYYELNRNFGMTEVQNANSNNAEANEEQAAVESAAETAAEAGESVPQAAQAEPAAPAPQPPKPAKPVKVQKPNRRKPQQKPQQDSAIHPTNKLPSLMPLRKMPNIVPNVPVSVPAEVVAVHEVDDEVKPVPSRYKKRPAVSYNSEKEVVEVPAPPFRVELVHTLSHPESYKRKRPAYTHKNKVVATKVAEEQPAVVQPAPEVVEAIEPVVPAVKFEYNLAAVPTTAEKEETIAAVAPVAEQVAAEIPMADAEPQASETGEIVVEPEQTLKSIVVQPSIPEVEITQAEEATVEVAQPVAEAQAEIVEETNNVEEPADEEFPKVEETQAEEVTKVEEPVAAEVEAAPEVTPAEEIHDEQPAAVAIEAIEETPAVIAEAPQITEVEEEQQEATANVEQPVQLEEHAQPNQPDELVADQLLSASAPAALDAESEVAAPVENVEEALSVLPSLEELEEQKPADAVETMPATPEMEQQDPIVEQAFEEKDAHLQTVGGFKPVDPEVAAEAEALISDFINTLRSENSNTLPMLPVAVEEDVSAAPVESEDTKVEIEATQDNEEKIAEEEAKPEEETPLAAESGANQLKVVAAEEPVSVEAENVPVVVEKDPIAEEEVKVSPLLKFPISNSFPADMYQIPVTVIQTPYEEVQQAETAVQEPQENTDEGVKVEVMQEQQQQEELVPAAEGSQQNVKFLPSEPEVEITEEQKEEKLPIEETVPETQSDILEPLEAAPEVAQSALTEASEPAPEEQPAVADVAESQPEIAQPATPVSFRPISIDDIVELVKERLDQAPANEKGAPMELVVDSSNADKPVELKFSLEKGSAPQEVSAEQTPAENIIFPIYHRVSEPESSDVKAQEIVAVEEPNAFVTELKKLPVEDEAVQEAVEPLVQTVDQAVQTDDAEVEANTAEKTVALNTETETEAEAAPAPVVNVQEIDAAAPEAAPVETEITTAEESAKANRALRSRSLTKAKLDPRKRRFLFRSDAS